MEMVFQYLYLSSLAELVDEDGGVKEDEDINQNNLEQDLSKYVGNDIENLLRPRLTKICVLASVYETTDQDTDYYCRTVFKDTCTEYEKQKYFTDNETKFHFLLNSKFNVKNISSLDDVYTIFKLNNTLYKLKFGIIKPTPQKNGLM